MARWRTVAPAGIVLLGVAALASRSSRAIGYNLPQTRGGGTFGDDWLPPIGHIPAGLANALGVVALAIALYYLARHWDDAVRTLRERWPKPRPDAPAPMPWAEDLDTEVRDRAVASLAQLRSSSDVGDAVLACWLRLEEAAAGHGVPRQPTQTSEEFTLTVLAGTSASVEPLRTIAHLYRRAMFDDVGLGEAERAACVTALEDLLASLERVDA